MLDEGNSRSLTLNIQSCIYAIHNQHHQHEQADKFLIDLNLPHTTSKSEALPTRINSNTTLIHVVLR